MEGEFRAVFELELFFDAGAEGIDGRDGDFHGPGGFPGMVLFQPLRQDIRQVGQPGQLMAHAIVQVMGDAALLARTDFEDFPLKAALFGDIVPDALHLPAAPAPPPPATPARPGIAAQARPRHGS